MSPAATSNANRPRPPMSIATSVAEKVKPAPGGRSGLRGGIRELERDACPHADFVVRAVRRAAERAVRRPQRAVIDFVMLVDEGEVELGHRRERHAEVVVLALES